MPRARPGYVSSLQARNALPLELLTSVQLWAVLASLAIIVVFVPLLWRRHSSRLIGLSLVIVSMVVANALITGAISMVEDRFECRVIWLVSFLAGICMLDWLNQRKAAKDTNS